MILFVASNPSKFNKDPKVAMIGSKSERVFNRFVKDLGVGDSYMVVNVASVVTDDNRPLKVSEYDLQNLIAYTTHPSVTKVIALGNTAADALNRIDQEFFKLPHPSPLNRFLNNEVQVEAVLGACKEWIGA